MVDSAGNHRLLRRVMGTIRGTDHSQHKQTTHQFTGSKMKKIPLFTIVILATITALLLAGCGNRSARVAGPMRVAASIAPLAYFSRQVGGDLVEVSLLVSPGSSPHTYQIEPDQMRFLSEAKVLVLNGIGLEFWADKAIDAADNPDLVVIETAKGLTVLESDGHAHGREDEHAEGNPHVWLDPIYAIHHVQTIRDAFIQADPENADTYNKNAADLVRKLEQLDKDIRAEVGKFKSKRFIAFHPAWVYFARRYGLEQAAVIEESPGKEPSAAQIRSVINTARRIGAKAIFAEPQFSPKAAEVIAEEPGARVLFLDPMGKPPEYDYIQMMRNNLQEMKKALGS